MPSSTLAALPHFGEFDQALTAFFNQCKAGTLAQTRCWVSKAPGDAFFNTATAYFIKPERASDFPAIPFQPFAQKLIVPAGSEVFFHADLHGDIRSLLADLDWLNQQGYLRDFGITRTNFYLIFLGDYTDRGSYGVEVLYTLLRLKLANPENVFLLRGNHEDYSLQLQTSQLTGRGFLDEGRRKYGARFDPMKVLRAYDFLPVVLYLGCGEDFIQCNHGGLEPGFDPRPLLDAASACFQLLGPLNQRRYFREHPEWLAADKPARASAAAVLSDFRPADPISPSPIGFMWNDFTISAHQHEFSNDVRRAFIYGQQPTTLFLRHAGTPTKRLQAIFRGHQQSSLLNPMMCRLLASRGIFRHWQAGDTPALVNANPSELANVLERDDERPIPSGSVWTFNVSPDSVYGEGCNYNFDAFGILKLTSNFADWRLKIINVPVGR